MRKVLSIALVVFGLLVLSADVKAQDDQPAAADTTAVADTVPTPPEAPRTWYTSFAEASNVARENKRYMLLVYQTEWCHWCQAMDDTTWNDPDILALAKRFVFTRIDGDIDTSVVARYNVRRFPTLVIVTDQGLESDRLVGYHAPGDLKEELTRILEGQGTIQDLEKRLSESRNDPKIMMAISRKYLERGEPLRAQEYLERAKSTDHDGTMGVADDALFLDAMIERDDKNWYKAIEHLRKLVKDFPESEWREDADLYIPWLYAQAGDDKEALKRYNEFLSKFGGSSETQWVKRQVAKLEEPESDSGDVPPSQSEGQ